MIYRFADFELDVGRYCLRRSGAIVPVERRVFDLLLYLVQNADRVVPKEEIFERIWNGRVVAAGSLTVAVSAARRALGDDATRQSMIATCQGRGYRFVSPISSTASGQDLATVRRAGPPADFVGREPALETFRSLVSSIEEGHSGILLVSGDAGIGKSRLIAEYAQYAAGINLAMQVAHCPESERTPYLWPCAQLVRRLLDTQDQEINPSASQRSVLAAILPDHFNDVLLETLSDPEAARFQTFDALASVLADLCSRGPHVLAIDDFHRADEGTARFLTFAVRELRSTPTALVIAFRPAEISRSTTHSQALAALAGEPYSVSISLPSLSLQDTAALAAALWKQQVPEVVAAELHQRTGGNPFFIRHILPDLPLSQPRQWGAAPPGLTQAILRRVAVLSGNAQEVLSTAAVIGREFSLSVLQKSCPHAGIEAAVDEAQAAGLVSFISEEPGAAAFVHVLVRDALYSSISSAERRRMHLAVGSALDTASNSASEKAAAEIARHLSASAEPTVLGRALELSVHAGKLAAQRAAHEDAAHHFALALNALEAIDPGNLRARCTLLLSRGTAQTKSGDRLNARGTLREAATVAASIGASRELARAALAVAPGFLAAEAGVTDSALEELLTSALDALPEAETGLRAEVASRLAMAIHWTERDGRMRDLIAMARACLGQGSDDRIRLQVRFAEWFCEWRSDELDRRHLIADEIETIATATSDKEMMLLGMVLRMVGMLERAEIANFDALLGRFDELAAHLRQPQSLWYASMYKSMRALLDGRLEDAEVYQRDFAALATRVNDANAFHSLAAQAAILHWERGTLQNMLGVVIDGVRRYPAIRGFRAGLAWAYLALGRMRDASREFEIVAANDFSDLPQRFDWSTAIGFSAEVCAVIADSRRARILYELLLPYRERVLVMGLGVGCFGPADRLLGMLAGTLGRIVDAEWHFERAIDLADTRGMPFWSGQVRVEYANWLLRSRRGSRPRAECLAQEAADVGISIGMPGLVDRARNAIRRSH